MTTEEPTQLDRIEAKLDQIISGRNECAACAERAEEELAELEQWKQEFAARHGLTGRLTPRPVNHDYDFGDDEQQKQFAQDIRNAVKAEGGHTGKPERDRWKTAIAIAGGVIAFAAVAAGSWWLWGVFIRMHC